MLKHDSNGRSSQQSRRGSLYDIPQRISSQQNPTSHIPIENPNSEVGVLETGNKYVQDSFETEKSNRRSSNAEDDLQANGARRKGSIRFSDEIQSVSDPITQREESLSKLPQDASKYLQKEYEYQESSQEYNPSAQDHIQQQQQQQQQIYSHPEFTDQRQYEQSGEIYNSTGGYDSSQYINQETYDNSQYGTAELQPSNEYDYQSDTQYQGFDTQNYTQPGEQPLENLYQSEPYQEENTMAEFDIKQNQPMQQQSYTDRQRYKVNGNGANSATQRQTMSKQPTKKKFT